jgi:hypothetical protein
MDWLNSTEVLNSLDPIKVVNEVGVWIIIAILGAFFGTVWLIIKQIFKRRTRKKEEKELIENLLSEIKKNQGQLYPFSVCVIKVLDQDIEASSKDDVFPNELNFKRDDYLVFSRSFVLLDNKIRGKVKEYYDELDFIDKGYPKLNIHESFSQEGEKKRIPFSWLIKLQGDKELGGDNNINKIETFLRNAKEEYDLGEKLIIKLKEII